MKTRYKQNLFILLTVLPIIFGIHEVQADEMRDLLIGRQGNCSKDDRDRTVLGCSGNTYNATVSINKVDVSGSKVTAHYNGKYDRDKFDIPCVKTANEQRNIFGSYSFEVKPGRIVWGNPTQFGEVNDPGHDSNAYAFCAVKNAVNSAMQ